MGSETFSAVAASAQARDMFGQSARTLVDEFDLDGIDVDWEHPKNAEEGKNMVLLLRSLRYHLPSHRYVLTSALPAGEWVLRNINLEDLSLQIDYLNLMGYDFTGPWSETSGHHAQLYSPSGPVAAPCSQSCQSAVRYVLSKGVQPKKVLLGIPVYGRSFLGVDGIGQHPSGHGGEEGTFDYKHLPRPGTGEQVDLELGAAFCVGGDGGFVTFDNPRTVRIKANFVREMGLGGLFYWTGTGDAKGSRSLVDTGFSALHGF